ncbi:MAG: DUF456 domain-containing protein [Bacteroidales bacterium]|nr:DUF456 domain-containing protein [Bacteroidales bacterium]MCR5114952.1 DUF456 domain-containing protein [Bacteroidales bacterium]
MNTVLIVFAIVCALVGIVGAIVPGLPGPPISWLGVLLLSFTPYSDDLTLSFLIITGVLAAVITVLDYVVPAWGTKKFGGSKAGVWGSTIGLVVSIFVLPVLGITIGPFGLVGILLGPFLGAYIGEKIHKTPNRQAWRAAFGSFIGFLVGTLMKLVYGIVILVFVVKDLILGVKF